MHALKVGSIATLLSCLALLAPASSQACGGCFHGPEAVAGVVTGHRMAFAVSPERTVLWDQIQYSGEPEDFSWVLPVLPGAYLEPSTDAWFESLEAATQTQITAPSFTCAQSDSGGGCGVMSAADSAPGRGFSGHLDGGVMVLHRGTVGPYETVTLRSTDGDALSDWLTANGYVIPPDVAPIIEAYVSEGADFIALRLSPGKGVQQMTPVRVVTPGGEYLLPLRMVAAGVGESVEIVLYVIGEQRYAMPDLHEVSVDLSKLTWTFAEDTTNYSELRRQALAKNLGFSYLPAFAFQGAFSRNLPGPGGGDALFTVANTGRSFGNLADLYFAQALANDDPAPAPFPDSRCPSVVSSLNADGLVVDLAPADTPSDAISASRFSCGAYTDISAAMIGMRPPNVWITRLELDLPKEVLGMDCVVVPADSQEEVSNQLRATKASDRPAGCEEVIFESRFARGVPGRAGMLLFLAAGVLSLLVRRRGAA
jgi:hypothetical protein